MDEAEDAPTAVWWVWTLLWTCALMSFWCQATVTEERLVPALNVISNHYKIPPDIAGATLMAAGASSPELFSSFVALFITHSALGLGTVVGSEIFNQLIICAGAVFASKTGNLILDKTILIREVGFYALAIALLYFSLRDSRPLDDDPDGPNHIYISFYEAAMVFSGYILYVIVCSNFEAIVSFFTKAKKSAGKALSSHNKGPNYGTAVLPRNLDQGKMDYLMEKVNLSDEPAGNWISEEYYMPATSTGEDTDASMRSSDSLKSLLSFNNATLKSLVRASERPSELNSLHDLHVNDYKNEISCFLFQRSIFYNKAYFGSNAWQLRYFTISPEKVSSVPDSCDPNNHRLRYPHFKAIEIDEKHLIIKIVNPVGGKRDYFLMAPSKTIFDKAIATMELFMDHNCTTSAEEIKASYSDVTLESENFEGADGHESLIEFQADSSIFEAAMFFLLFPLRLMMHLTVPDVRVLDENGEPTATIGKAYLSTLLCLVWLIIGSYAMVASLEALGELLGISDAIMGFTVSAAGTSLPNYVASKVAAEKGFGNQAVSNAFGSNTFNIMVGLGLPWVLYIGLGNNFEPYHSLKDEHIIDSILILAIVLGIFVALMIASNCVMYKWHGILFLLIYLSYIVYAILVDT
jgi:K+-dependent Na+/Ca+ exchanger-like protein